MYMKVTTSLFKFPKSTEISGKAKIDSEHDETIHFFPNKTNNGFKM